MSIEKRLRTWVDAKLIDQGQADKIIIYEQEHASVGWILFGLSTLGIIIVLTGIVSVIAANWDEISPTAKLFLYFASLISLGWFAYKNSGRPGVLRESLITAFGLYVLAGIGLIGQIYHMQSDGYEALFFWLVIILPVTLAAQSKTLCNAWFLGLAAAMSIWFAVGPWDEFATQRLYVLVAAPFFFLGIGYGLSDKLSEHFSFASRFWSYVTILVPFAIMANAAWSNGSDLSRREFRNEEFPLIPIACYLFAILGVLTRSISLSKTLSKIMCATISLGAFFIIYPLYYDIQANDIAGCGFFILLWAGAAAIAAAMNRKRLFDLCASVIGLRFIVVYFEVFGSLAATGIGLIISGSVILGIAYLWHNYRQKVAAAILEKI